MKRLPAGQFMPIPSPLHGLNALAKLVCFFLTLGAVVLTNSLSGYALMLLFTAFSVLLCRLPASVTLFPLVRMRFFFLFIFLMNALFFGAQTPLFTWWVFRPSLEGMAQGANVVLRVALLMVLSAVLTSTTAPVDLTNALVRLMRPLKLFKAPVEDIAMIISVAIRFIPTLLEEADTLKKAQTARGARFESRSLKDRALSVTPLVVPIFIAAFRRADELALAMEARGYRAGKKRVSKAYPPLTRADYAALALCLLLLALQIYL